MAKIAPAPGQRMVKRMSTRAKWLILSTISLILVCAGLCVLIEAGSIQHAGAPLRQWLPWYLYALVLVGGGLLVFGRGLRYRIALDYRRFVRREWRKRERELVRRK